jgi:hypothetical protein
LEDLQMSRVSKIPQVKAAKKNQDWPLVIYVWMFGLGILGYTLARIVLYTSPHPYHWLSAIAGGLIGVLVGKAWYHWKGDIV